MSPLGRNPLWHSPGERFGRVVLIEHVRQPSHKHWRMRCDCGREFVRQISTLTGSANPSCGFQPCNPRGRSDVVTYAAAHYRLYAERGPARDYECVVCGGPAREWAYDYTDPSPLVAPTGTHYSMDSWRYRPMCCSCHTLHDNRTKESSQ